MARKAHPSRPGWTVDENGTEYDPEGTKRSEGSPSPAPVASPAAKPSPSPRPSAEPPGRPKEPVIAAGTPLGERSKIMAAYHKALEDWRRRSNTATAGAID